MTRQPEQTAIQLMLTKEDERLVQRTVRWVVLRQQISRDQGMEEELYHYGLVGLLEAKKSFNQQRKIPFPAFAVHRVRGAMIDYLRTAPVIRVPQKQQELRRQLQEARHDLSHQKIEETDQALARQLDWPVDEVRRVAALQTRVVSLAGQQPGSGDVREQLTERDLPSTDQGPEAGVMRKELKTIVRGCLEKIRSTRDRMILIGRVLHDRTLRELAEGLNCSLETVRLRQQQAEQSMRRCLENHGWEAESLNEMVR